jgi:hypothetical protein
MSFFLVVIVLVALLVVGGVVAGMIVWRHRQAAPTLARPVERPPFIVRLAEGLVLVMIGIALGTLFMFFGQFSPADLGLFKVHLPALYHVWLVGLIILAAGLAVVLTVAVLLRTWVAAALMVVWLAGAVFCVGNNNSTLLAGVMGVTQDQMVTLYTLANIDYPHVQLYVNGVALGEAPVTLTMEEFLAKVPVWSQPPEGVTEEEFRYHKLQQGPRPWTRFETPQYMAHWTGLQRADAATYYAQAELDGEWGAGYGGGSGGGGGGHVQSYEASLGFKFPKFDERVRRHMEQAGEAGKGVDVAWVAEAEKFGNRGWQILREMIAKEPQRYQPVLDGWARVHYAIPEPLTADGARQVLERVAAEAEALGRYDTQSVAGAAIDQVVASLDVGWLVRAANDGLRRGIRGYSYSQSGGGFSTHGSRTSQDSLAPMRDYVLAHAVWHKHLVLEAQKDAPHPNRIQTEVLPSLVYSSGDSANNNLALDMAIRLGWPGAFDFIYRHDWKRDVRDVFDRDAISVGNGRPDSYVNGWLVLLLNLDCPEARAFRNKENGWALGVADKVVRSAFADVDLEKMRFLFMDNDLGAESLAVKFWPRFREGTRDLNPGQGIWGLQARVRYLVRTEPNATPEMWREALAITASQPGWIPADDLQSLPPDRQIAVIDIWKDLLGEIASGQPHPDHLAWLQPKEAGEWVTQLEQKRKEIAGRKPRVER